MNWPSISFISAYQNTPQQHTRLSKLEVSFQLSVWKQPLPGKPVALSNIDSFENIHKESHDCQNVIWRAKCASAGFLLEFYWWNKLAIIEQILATFLLQHNLTQQIVATFLWALVNKLSIRHKNPLNKIEEVARHSGALN